jgi:L-aminopeptidase/D-esterase-like protein
MRMYLMLAFLLVSSVEWAVAAETLRARDLGVPFDGITGELNAITDVSGVEVGHSTIIRGSGALKVGKGPVRTGVTAVLPRGRKSMDAVFAAWFSQNGNGEMTGTTWVEESGQMWGPVMITNTHSVGVVRDAVIDWGLNHAKLDRPVNTDDWWGLPVVGETWDGWLNDLNGFHVKREHAFEALDSAQPGPVQEGNVGGGTGMICYEFKGGIGTSSRLVKPGGQAYMVGVLVQANFGWRSQLMVSGVPVGKEIPDSPAYAGKPLDGPERDMGSIIAVVATDAPVLPHQLKRMVRRVSMGIARTGGVASDSSGDIFIAFSTNADPAATPDAIAQLSMLPNPWMTQLFEAVVQATEEAIINALVAAETMTGRDNHVVVELPHDRLRDVLRKYNRLQDNEDGST